MKLDISAYNVYEKFEWLQDHLGDYKSLDMLFYALKNSSTLEQICVDHSNINNEVLGTNLIEWWLVGNTAFELLELLVARQQPNLEETIDELVKRLELDEVDPRDEFEYTSEWIAYRNK